MKAPVNPSETSAGNSSDGQIRSALNIASAGAENDSGPLRTFQQVYHGPEISTLPGEARFLLDGAIHFLTGQNNGATLNVEVSPKPINLPHAELSQLYTFDNNRVISVRILSAEEPDKMVIVNVGTTSQTHSYFPQSDQTHWVSLLDALGFKRIEFGEPLEVSTSAPENGIDGKHTVIMGKQ